MTRKNLQIDRLDRQILELLSQNAKIPFIKIAEKCGVSGAAIHQRVQRLEDAGVILGSRFTLSPKALGYTSCAYIGVQINLITARTHGEVFEEISNVKEIVECHHITGKYSLLLKVYAKDNEHLKNIIVERIQSIVEVTFTETFLSLQEGFSRLLPIK